MDSTSVGTGARRAGSTASSSTRNSHLLVQNGSFFYPKRVGFRQTAVYTAILGERDMKKYHHVPAEVSLGSDRGVATSTVRDAYTSSANLQERQRCELAPMAGNPTSNLKKKKESTFTEKRVIYPPGGPAHVALAANYGAADENAPPLSTTQQELQAAVASPNRRRSLSTQPAGRPCLVSDSSAEPTARQTRYPGGTDHLKDVIQDASCPFPQSSMLQDDLQLPHHPVMRDYADRELRHGVVDEPEWNATRSKLRTKPEWYKTNVTLNDGVASEGFAASTVWEEDISRALDTNVIEESKATEVAGVRVEQKFCGTVRILGDPTSSSVVLQYATERDNVSAAMSPPRCNRNRAPPAVLCNAWNRKKRVESSSGGSDIISMGDDVELRSSYQDAFSGDVKEPARRRSLVRRVQDVGGRTTVSLAFDPHSAGKPCVLTGGVAIAPPPLPPAAAIAHVHTGRRFAHPLPYPDQVVITDCDYERLKHFGLEPQRRSSIRRVAGGSSTIVIA